MLGYKNKRGAHITMPIQPKDVEITLIKLWRQRFEAVIWIKDNRNLEIGWVYKHEEAGWSWAYDTNILK